MRPAMRLPLREALYVCSNCRQEAIPRVSPLARQFQLQTRRYASDSPSFLDRTRRKIWNTEKPPGAEDPYTGDSQLLQSAGKPEGGLAGGVNAEGELGEGEQSSLAEGDGYTQAEDWKGLTTVGYLPEEKWIQTGTIKADKYRPFGHQVRPLPILEASYLAAVEICLLHLLDKPLTSICEVKRHNPQIRQMLESCTVQPSGEKGWDIMFPDEKTKETLVFVFNQIGGKSDCEIKSTSFVERDRKDPRAEMQLYRSLSLDDPNIKFAYIKRLTQLYGRRISDKAITSSNTIGKVISSLSWNLKQKPKNVNKSLSHEFAAGNLPPNLAFHSSRIRPSDRDEDYGRKKAIYSEYIERGLPIPKQKTKRVSEF